MIQCLMKVHLTLMPAGNVIMPISVRGYGDLAHVVSPTLRRSAWGRMEGAVVVLVVELLTW